MPFEKDLEQLTTCLEALKPAEKKEVYEFLSTIPCIDDNNLIYAVKFRNGRYFCNNPRECSYQKVSSEYDSSREHKAKDLKECFAMTHILDMILKYGKLKT